MKKVELLAPAGNYDSFLCAIHAGADAVYLGGSRFGARAYADNFTEEEICRAIRYAHIYGRKVYLTVNTLVKENEFPDIYDYMMPFYLAGLDGVIIQDMGVFSAVGKWFPDLKRHISTQMTVTGAYGAARLKAAGAVRLVPARELSLDEIKDIKKNTDIEVETFVHGAVCYCYSGQCLFSSILGGRSGNRGRCAQPCRLPYEVSMEGKTVRKGEYYPLSLKDMCTIEILPCLIEAGIDSFKIEGRMKSPEYVAGVTSLYRKYIDIYYAHKENAYHVSKEDMEALTSLYIRSEISTGYYDRYNGKDMVTLDNPSYAKREDKLTARLKQTYLKEDYRLAAAGTVHLYKGHPAIFEISYRGITVRAEGSIAEAALKQPLTEGGVRKQLNKSGNTFFRFEHIETDMEKDVFLPVKALNDLRRMACEKLEIEIIRANGLAYPHRMVHDQCIEDTCPVFREYNETALYVLALTKEQLLSAMKSNISRIYLCSDMLTDHKTAAGIFESLYHKAERPALYLALPYIIRKKDRPLLKTLEVFLKEQPFDGVLARNQEELAWLLEIGYSKAVETDANMYLFNKYSYDAYGPDTQEHYLPYELNYPEIARLLEGKQNRRFSHIVYGRIPMMITANCIAKTCDKCRHLDSGCFGKLKDRYRKEFPVYMNCRQCYNVIYNSVPLSLHQNICKLKKLGITAFRLDFTTETGNDVDKIISFYKKVLSEPENKKQKAPFAEYTNGHFKRGVE